MVDSVEDHWPEDDWPEDDSRVAKYIGIAVFVLVNLLVVVVFSVAMLFFVFAVVIEHPECASIPGDVGPCGFWNRAEFYGFLSTPILSLFALMGLWVLFSVWLGFRWIRD